MAALAFYFSEAHKFLRQVPKIQLGLEPLTPECFSHLHHVSEIQLDPQYYLMLPNESQFVTFLNRRTLTFSSPIPRITFDLFDLGSSTKRLIG